MCFQRAVQTGSLNMMIKVSLGLQSVLKRVSRIQHHETPTCFKWQSSN